MPTIRVFVSYAREDCLYLGWREEGGRWIVEEHSARGLIPWLARSIQRRHDAVFWYDLKDLRPAEEFRQRIEDEIDQADVAILLLSSEFLNSDFIQRVELPRIRARAMRHELRVVPILVEPSRWQEVDFIATRQILPGRPTPLVDFDTEKSWASVRDEILGGIEHVVEQVEKERSLGRKPSLEQGGDVSAGPATTPGPLPRPVPRTPKRPARFWIVVSLLIVFFVALPIIGIFLWPAKQPRITATWDVVQDRSIRVNWEISALPAEVSADNLYLVTTEDHQRYWRIAKISGRSGSYVFGLSEGQRYVLIGSPTKGPIKDEMGPEEVKIVVETELPK